MPADENEIMENHEYDGIQEMDNKLPRWWVWLFVGAVIFSPIYFVWFHVLGITPLPQQQYEQEMARAEARIEALNEARAEAEGETPVEAIALVASKDAEVLAHGKTLFTTHCLACHMETAGGLVGPNLTDDFWIHGPTFANNVQTILDGVPEKGMISWRPILKEDEIMAVASYIYSLRGSAPAGGKAPEGTPYPGSDSPDYTGPEA